MASKLTFEDFIKEAEEDLEIFEIKKKLEVLRRSRGNHKRKITFYLKTLQDFHDSKVLTATISKI